MTYPVMNQIDILILCFFAYTFMGWFYESTIWAICEKKRFINRGYLLGPCCPIYGVVSFADLYFFADIENPAKIFILGMLVCSVLEYLTSAIMERLFHTRWWDYSNYPFNINGRISLYSSLLFGALGLLLVKVVHPKTYELISKIPDNIRLFCAILICVLFIIDIILTTICINNLNKKIKKIHEFISSKMENPFIYLNERKDFIDKNIIFKVGKGLLLKMEGINEKIKLLEIRLIKAFPSMKSEKYQDIIQQINEALKNKRNK